MFIYQIMVDAYLFSCFLLFFPIDYIPREKMMVAPMKTLWSIVQIYFSLKKIIHWNPDFINQPHALQDLSPSISVDLISWIFDQIKLLIL